MPSAALIGDRKVQNYQKSIDKLVKLDDHPNSAVCGFLLSELEGNR